MMFDGDCLRHIYIHPGRRCHHYIYTSIIIGIAAISLDNIGKLTLISCEIIINVLISSTLVDGDLSYN
jgi:hypothetical protein